MTQSHDNYKCLRTITFRMDSEKTNKQVFPRQKYSDSEAQTFTVMKNWKLRNLEIHDLITMI